MCGKLRVEVQDKIEWDKDKLEFRKQLQPFELKFPGKLKREEAKF